MHGVRRTRQSPEALAAKRVKAKDEIVKYLALNDAVLQRRRESDLTEETFKQTSELLRWNPDFYTVWNYRREILTIGIFASRTPEQVNDELTSELILTTELLRSHPKTYWIWNHRRWCLENVPEGPGLTGSNEKGWKREKWDNELKLVEMILGRDARNFHAWGYRRYVLASHPSPPSQESELQYTEQKIRSSSTNFSAWHQRSKIYEKLAQTSTQSRNIDIEFELVNSAIWTDPSDQSAWIYHRWLMSETPSPKLLEREITSLEELLTEEPDSKWCLDTLVHYKLKLVDYLGPCTRSKSIRNECGTLLDKLKHLDPLRTRRYEELIAAVLN